MQFHVLLCGILTLTSQIEVKRTLFWPWTHLGCKSEFFAAYMLNIWQKLDANGTLIHGDNTLPFS